MIDAARIVEIRAAAYDPAYKESGLESWDHVIRDLLADHDALADLVAALHDAIQHIKTDVQQGINPDFGILSDTAAVAAAAQRRQQVIGAKTMALELRYWLGNGGNEKIANVLARMERGDKPRGFADPIKNADRTDSGPRLSQ